MTELMTGTGAIESTIAHDRQHKNGVRKGFVAIIYDKNAALNKRLDKWIGVAAKKARLPLDIVIFFTPLYSYPFFSNNFNESNIVFFKSLLALLDEDGSYWELVRRYGPGCQGRPSIPKYKAVEWG